MLLQESAAEWDFYSIEDVESLLAKHLNFTAVTYHYLVFGVYRHSKLTTKRILGYFSDELVKILFPINIEADLPCFVCDAILSLWPKHHLTAVHEIVHAVLQSWQERLRVDNVKVYQIVSGDLNPDISLCVINEASMAQRVVLFPSHLLLIIFDNFNLLEKEHQIARSGYNCLVIHQVHLAKVVYWELLKLVDAWILNINCKHLTMSVKHVSLVLLLVVEALVRKIHIRITQVFGDR